MCVCGIEMTFWLPFYPAFWLPGCSITSLSLIQSTCVLFSFSLSSNFPGILLQNNRLIFCLPKCNNLLTFSFIISPLSVLISSPYSFTIWFVSFDLLFCCHLLIYVSTSPKWLQLHFSFRSSVFSAFWMRKAKVIPSFKHSHNRTVEWFSE